MAHPGQVEIIATAPLTNIATALMLEPRLPQNWKMLHLASGEFLGALGQRSDAYWPRYLGYRDLNLNVDSKAAQYVLDHADHFIVYPNEIMDDARFTRADHRALKKAGTPLAVWVADETAPFLHTLGLVNALSGHPGIYLHGVIPAAIAFEPSLAEAPQELRVVMRPHKIGGYSFAISPDDSVPARPVHVRLRDPKSVETRLLERCQ
jgi:inosine-uridine nucleoside N-ribohydrolase